MSFYSDASLVMIPSGYKTSKVYSAVPTDGSGDLTFSRTADTATRVGPDGLIEKVRTNRLLQSNTFNNATWTINGTGTVTTGATDPFGGTTAWTLAKTSLAAFLYQSTAGFSGSVTFSIYAKAGTVDQLWLNHDQSGSFSSYFDLTLGTAISPAGCVATIVSVGGGWYRCSIAGTVATPNNIRIYPASGGSVSGTTGNILIYGIQGETSDIATSYIATTSAAVSVGPVANVPRLDYLNSSCPRLLLEPQRTNLALYSEQFSNAAWSKNQSTISSNSAISPDGYMSADKLIEDSSNAFHDINQLPFSTTGGQTYTFSIFVKPDTRSKIRIGYGALVNFDAFGGDVSAIIDVSNKTVISSVLSPTVLFSDFENGYVRVTFLKQATGSGQFNLIFGLVNNSNAASYLGDGSSGLFIWGAQMEAGYATSYIPTLGAAVTRGADAASKTSASALIGTSAGTIFIDCFGMPTDNNSRILTITGGAEEFLIFMEPTPTGNIGLFGTYSGLQYISIGGANDTRYKIAYAWSANNYALYVNGVAISLTQSASVYSALDRIDLNQAQSGAEKGKTVVNQFISFPVRLSNSDLAALTA